MLVVDHRMLAESPAAQTTLLFGTDTVMLRCAIVKFVFDVSFTAVCVTPLIRIRAVPLVGLEANQRYEPLFAIFDAIVVQVAEGYVLFISIVTFSDMFCDVQVMSLLSPTAHVTAVLGDVTVSERRATVKFASDVSLTLG